MKPGLVTLAPSINNLFELAPADQVRETPLPVSTRCKDRGFGYCGNSLTCASTLRLSAARPAVNWWGRMVSGRVVVANSRQGDDGWKEMLAPAS